MLFTGTASRYSRAFHSVLFRLFFSVHVGRPTGIGGGGLSSFVSVMGGKGKG